jgi:hypothetical protein
LTDKAFVVRGGVMELVHLYVSIDLALDRQTYMNLSFFGCDARDAYEICRRNPMKNRQVRVARAGDMRTAGFDPYPQGTPDHLEVRFATRPTDNELERLIAVFGIPIPNPHPAS